MTCRVQIPWPLCSSPAAIGRADIRDRQGERLGAGPRAGIALGFFPPPRVSARHVSSAIACARPIPSSIPRYSACASSRGAALVMAPYSAAFGAMLAIRSRYGEQTVWGWSALKTGLAIAPGPLLVPITSAAVRWQADRALRRGHRDHRRRSCFFSAGLAAWATLIGAEPNAALVVLGMIPDRHRRRP